MRINKRIAAVCLLLIGASAATAAMAARMYAYEIGYFDQYGNMVGSVTYPCGGGKTVEGILEGTPVEIWSETCLNPDNP